MSLHPVEYGQCAPPAQVENDQQMHWVEQTEAGKEYLRRGQPSTASTNWLSVVSHLRPVLAFLDGFALRGESVPEKRRKDVAMAFLEIRTSTPISVFLIVLGLPASGAFLLFGMGCLADLTNPDGGVVAAVVFCALGVFLLLMTIAAFRGILHRNKSSSGEHET
jgi:hypothetical protein